MKNVMAFTQEFLPAPSGDLLRYNTEQFFGHDTGLFYVELGKNGPSDQTLLSLAEQMRDEQRRVLGHIQVKGDALGKCHCREMHLIDLSSGLSTQISESRGAEARGCHLDWAALTEVAQSIESDLSLAPDILIINRFGRAEAEGKGMRGAIEKALALKIPVIVGVRPNYTASWKAFHGGIAESVSLQRRSDPFLEFGSEVPQPTF